MGSPCFSAAARRAAYDAFAPYLYEEAPQLYNASDETSMLAAAAHHAAMRFHGELWVATRRKEV